MGKSDWQRKKDSFTETSNRDRNENCKNSWTDETSFIADYDSFRRDLY